ASAVSSATPQSPAKPAPTAQPNPPTATPPQVATPTAPSAQPAQHSRPSATSQANGQTTERVFASPLARRIARERNIALETVQGTGPHGRIILRDVEQVAARPAGSAVATTGVPAAQTPTALTPQPAGDRPVGGLSVEPMADSKVLALYQEGTYEVVPHDGMRRVIAQRLTQSKQTVPHFYLTIDCVLDELLRARSRLNDAAPKDGPRAYKLSVNDFVIKALALALQQVPDANATWTDAGMLRHRHSDVGVAVAVEGGLFTPVIRHAEMKTLGEISNEMKDLAARARNRRLAPHEYQGGTTSISNLGMFGIKSFDAVINPPHATILAVGAGEKRAIVVGNDIKVATIMSCTLSCDHRVVDGALAAELFNAFKALIEEPVRMLV
ncbi:MAG: 2-oxo acid dehydrogenase subunit E2, partial [Hyphomicrobiaceae bacterium]|nr:2-oxo acid dehydrogenase subunit E2 [Hyphomicrobiaceae bacterium]